FGTAGGSQTPGGTRRADRAFGNEPFQENGQCRVLCGDLRSIASGTEPTAGGSGNASGGSKDGREKSGCGLEGSVATGQFCGSTRAQVTRGFPGSGIVSGRAASAGLGRERGQTSRR